MTTTKYTELRPLIWDLEVWSNYHVTGLLDLDGNIELHYLINDDREEEIARAARYYMNRHENTLVTLHNLKHSTELFEEHFRYQIPQSGNSLLGNLLQIQKEIRKENKNLYIGYNTLGYDLYIIHYLLNQIFAGKLQISTEKLRELSNQLIERTYKTPISLTPYEKYGHHVDLTRVNERQMQNGVPTLALKTAEGLFGGSIIESRSNTRGYSIDIFGDTIYLMNDLTETRDRAYKELKGKVDARLALFDDFDYLEDTHATLNSTSSALGTAVVQPTGMLEDIPVVDYLYPAEHIAKEYNIEPYNVLNYAENWYMTNVYNQVVKHNPVMAKKHLASFLSMIGQYKEAEGLNFNDNPEHLEKFKVDCFPRKERNNYFKQIYATHLEFIDKYGNPVGSDFNASIGGAHGQDYNLDQFTRDKEMVTWLYQTFGQFSKVHKEIKDEIQKYDSELWDIIQKQSRETVDGKHYPLHLLHEAPVCWRGSRLSDTIVNPDYFSPYLIDSKKGNILLDRYHYTTATQVIHQDFSGYYPMLLINTGAFYDGKGRDVYREVYNKRIHVKTVLLPQEKYGSEKWIQLNNLQEAYKLILNSLSGDLDGTLQARKAIKANNKAFKMRVIGQLFTYILCQALALEGARIPSTNTDGFYISGISEELNNEIITRELKPMLMTIEPETMGFVSKGTNERIEITPDHIKAGGKGVESFNGPNITKNLDHPAIIDAVAVKYLQKENITNLPFDRAWAKECLDEYIKENDLNRVLFMAAWIFRARRGNFFMDQDKNIYDGTQRIFLTKEGLSLTKAQVKKTNINDQTLNWANQLESDDPIGNPEIIQILKEKDCLDLADKAERVSNYTRCKLQQKDRKDPKIDALVTVKIPNWPTWNPKAMIYNDYLDTMPQEEAQKIFDQLDQEAYLDLMDAFISNWLNHYTDSHLEDIKQLYETIYKNSTMITQTEQENLF